MSLAVQQLAALIPVGARVAIYDKRKETEDADRWTLGIKYQNHFNSDDGDTVSVHDPDLDQDFAFFRLPEIENLTE